MKTIKLTEYFELLKNKHVQSITFVEDYFQIRFVDGVINCISETVINTVSGSFEIPSKEGNWEVVKLLGKEITSIEEKPNEVIIHSENGSVLTVNTRLGPAGDTFHLSVEDFATMRL